MMKKQVGKEKGISVKLVSAMLAVMLFLSGCGGEAAKDDPVKDPTPGVTSLENTLVWAVPEAYLYEADQRIARFNRFLEENGESIGISLYPVAEENYYETVCSLLENGKVDIVNLGIKHEYELGNSADKFLSSGLLYDLTDYLHSEEGKPLYESAHEARWTCNSYEGRILAIPNQFGFSGGTYMAIQNQLTGQYQSGDRIDELLSELKDEITTENPMVFSRGCPINTLANCFGYEYYNGVMIDGDTGEVFYPYDVEEVMDCLDFFRELYQGGRLLIVSNEEECRAVPFSVGGFLDIWDNYRLELQEEYTLLQMPFYFSTARVLGTGISKNSAHTEEALRLLQKLYTDTSYANALMYGIEGEDFIIKDGYASCSATSYPSLMCSLAFGIYDNVTPQEKDEFAYDRKNTRQQWTNSGRGEYSLLTGFFVDETAFPEGAENYWRRVEELWTHWYEPDFAQQAADLKAEMMENGEYAYVQILAAQIGEYLE